MPGGLRQCSAARLHWLVDTTTTPVQVHAECLEIRLFFLLQWKLVTEIVRQLLSIGTAHCRLLLRSSHFCCCGTRSSRQSMEYFFVLRIGDLLRFTRTWRVTCSSYHYHVLYAQHIVQTWRTCCIGYCSKNVTWQVASKANHYMLISLPNFWASN